MLRSRSLTFVLSGAGAAEESCALNIVDDKVNQNPSASMLKAAPEKCFTCIPFCVLPIHAASSSDDTALAPVGSAADCRDRADPSIPNYSALYLQKTCLHLVARMGVPVGLDPHSRREARISISQAAGVQYLKSGTTEREYPRKKSGNG